jgi:hypothetical protein
MGRGFSSSDMGTNAVPLPLHIILVFDRVKNDESVSS